MEGFEAEDDDEEGLRGVVCEAASGRLKRDTGSGVFCFWACVWMDEGEVGVGLDGSECASDRYGLETGSRAYLVQRHEVVGKAGCLSRSLSGSGNGKWHAVG